jgi:hypothetical protein
MVVGRHSLPNEPAPRLIQGTLRRRLPVLSIARGDVHYGLGELVGVVGATCVQSLLFASTNSQRLPTTGAMSERHHIRSWMPANCVRDTPLNATRRTCRLPPAKPWGDGQFVELFD